MIYEIQYTDEALKVIEKYKKSNQIAYKKVMRLIKEITEHPREGTGHPEPLSGGDGITYSRHISKKNRIIYDIFDDIVVVIIVSVEGHYDDK
jgi:toxin YoeB